MRVNTNTALIVLLGVAVLGGGTYLILRDRKREQPTGSRPSGGDDVATALNVSGSQYDAVIDLFEKAMSSIQGGTDPRLAQQNLIGGYLEMGLGGAAQIADIVSKFLPKASGSSGGGLQPGDPGTYYDPGLKKFVNAATGRPI